MKKFLSVLTIIAVVFMSAVPVFADYTAVAGPAIVGMQTTMDVEDGATVPATTVAYSIAAGAAVTNPGTGELPVQAGPHPELVVLDSVAFTCGQTVTRGVATTSWNISFSAVEFSAPGVYRYVVTQGTIDPATVSAKSSESGFTTIDIFVEDNNGTLVPAAVVYDGLIEDAAKKNGTVDANALGEKDSVFALEYVTYDLTAGKTVTGNQGDKDKVWHFDVVIEGLVAGTVVNFTDVDGSALPLEADAAGKIEHTFEVKHDEEFSAVGLPAGSTYKISEQEANADGYTTTGSMTAAENCQDGVEVDIVNNRTGAVPTGVALYAGVGIALMLGAGVYLGSKSRKKED